MYFTLSTFYFLVFCGFFFAGLLVGATAYLYYDGQIQYETISLIFGIAILFYSAATFTYVSKEKYVIKPKPPTIWKRVKQKVRFRTKK